jgi:hypothetical protein
MMSCHLGEFGLPEWDTKAIHLVRAIAASTGIAASSDSLPRGTRVVASSVSRWVWA